MQSKRPGRGATEDHIVVVVPVELKNMVEPIRALIEAARQARSSVRGSQAIDYAAIEQTVEERVAELERATHIDLLSALDVDAPRVHIGGREFTRIGHSPGRFRTMTGPVVVPRAVYRELGVRNPPSVDAISLRIGVVGDGWLPKAAQSMAHLGAA